MNKRYRSDSAILIVGTVCAAIGLLTLLGLVIQINLWTEFKKTGVPVTAEITQIEARRSGTSRHRRTVHDVYIRYTYNGTVYENELDYYSLGMSKGQTVDILIDPSSPQRIKSSPVPVVSIAVTSLFFLIFFGVGGGFLGNEIRKSIIINNLISTDRYIICQDWEERISNVRVNNVSYLCIKAYYNDGVNNYVFTSRSFSPYKTHPLMPGESVTVYVDLDHPKVHYVDIDI